MSPFFLYLYYYVKHTHFIDIVELIPELFFPLIGSLCLSFGFAPDHLPINWVEMVTLMVARADDISSEFQQRPAAVNSKSALSTKSDR